MRLFAADTKRPAAMGHQELVETRPHQLQFTFELNKPSSCVVHLINNTNEYVAFKVKGTAPKRYGVNPNTGVILPRKSCEFTVTMQGLLRAPPGMQTRNKFLVQTTVVPHGTSDKQLIPALFSQESGRYTEETKLSVVLVSVHQSLEQQPTNGIHDTGLAVPNIGNEVLDVANDVPVPLVQTLAIVSEDVQKLKSTLNNLESKLEETEKMVIRLQREMAFCLLFMVFTALLCISLGYLLRLSSSEPGMLRMWQEK